MVTAIICLSLLLSGALFLLYRAQNLMAAQCQSALDVMKSKDLNELAHYHAARSQTALNVEMLRDQFQKEVAGEIQPPSPPRTVKDLNGNTYNIDDLEII